MSSHTPRLEELYTLLSSFQKGCLQADENIRKVISEALESGDPESRALAAVLAGELGIVEAAERLKELVGLENVVELRDPSTGEVQAASLGAIAREALAKLRAKKVEAELLKLAIEEPAHMVRAVITGAGVSAEELASKLKGLKGVEVIHVFRLVNVVSIEAEASKILEVADLKEVASVRRAGVVRALGEVE
ncbi:MAG: hypothetical protein QXU62_01870 [Thermofilaceae archaeon]|uniref:Uncharacterized protein n=1 Tax=Thermofilum pendens TaxID=2269 RepID=A0A7C4D549_THEPE